MECGPTPNTLMTRRPPRPFISGRILLKCRIISGQLCRMNDRTIPFRKPSTSWGRRSSPSVRPRLCSMRMATIRRTINRRPAPAPFRRLDAAAEGRFHRRNSGPPLCRAGRKRLFLELVVEVLEPGRECRFAFHPLAGAAAGVLGIDWPQNMRARV